MREIIKIISVPVEGKPRDFRLTKLDAFSGVSLLRYRQAVKDYEKAQKQVNALEEEAVKALTGESQLDLKVVNAMLLKHREKLRK